MLFRFQIRSGIVCWWCSLGSFHCPGRLAYSWNSANGCPVPVKRTLFWESSLPCWRFSSRFSQRSGRILTRQRGRFSIGSIGWSVTQLIYSPVSSLPNVVLLLFFFFNSNEDFRLSYAQPCFLMYVCSFNHIFRRLAQQSRTSCMDGLDSSGLRRLLRHHSFNIVGKHKPHSTYTFML